MATSADKIRAWTGPALLGFGFRPLFLLAGIWATLGMVLWIVMLVGREPLPIGWDQYAWHAHEFVFGYTSAVIGGFLLTAVPNWTGRLPVVGWPLAGLVALWLLGRGAVALGAHLPWGLVMAADLAFVVVLGGLLLREIVTGKNWRNLPVIGILAVLTLANALFHLEGLADGHGMRLGLGAIVLLIALIGGRIIPSFSRNWLAARQIRPLPQPPTRADRGVMALTAVALAGFVLRPDDGVTAALLAVTGVAHLWRQSRWCPRATAPEPLLWVLHVAYLFLSLGFLAVAAGGVDLLPVQAARHVWLVGCLGLMTLAVMGRAALGHTGRPLTAGPALAACYVALIVLVPVRLAAGFWPGQMGWLHLSALLWMLGFGGFTVLFWPVLTRPRLAPKRVSTVAN